MSRKLWRQNYETDMHAKKGWKQFFFDAVKNGSLVIAVLEYKNDKLEMVEKSKIFDTNTYKYKSFFLFNSNMQIKM